MGRILSSQFVDGHKSSRFNISEQNHICIHHFQGYHQFLPNASASASRPSSQLRFKMDAIVSLIVNRSKVTVEHIKITQATDEYVPSST